jgi:hypothetical protein
MLVDAESCRRIWYGQNARKRVLPCGAGIVASITE